jgi:hypothetical protein
MLAAFFGASGGALVSSGAGAESGHQDAVAVSLARLAGGRAAAADPQTQALAALYQKVLSERGEVAADDHRQTPHDRVQRLFDALDRAAGQGAGSSKWNGTGADDATSQAKSAKQGDQVVKNTGDGPGATASAGKLWGAIEPCWRAVPQVSRVPVTLIIMLDEGGRVSAPPLIVRPDMSQPDETRLISEARALAAVSACVPYHSADFLGGQRRFTVQFGVTRQ